MCRILVVDANGVVIGSEPAPEHRYCSEEEQKRIRQHKAMENFFYEEGYRDAQEGHPHSTNIIYSLHGLDAANAYFKGYTEFEMENYDGGDSGYCGSCGKYH